MTGRRDRTNRMDRKIRLSGQIGHITYLHGLSIKKISSFSLSILSVVYVV